MLAFLVLLATGFALWRIGRRTRFFLHVAQLDGYKPHEVAAWVRARTGTHVLRRSHLVGLGLVALGWAVALAGWPRTATHDARVNAGTNRFSLITCVGNTT